MTVLGIDLGTTFSVMARLDPTGRPMLVSNAEQERTTPSVIWFDPDGGIVVGAAARNQAIIDPERVVECVKRHMGDPSFRFEVDGVEHLPEELSGLILSKLRRDASAALGEDVKSAVISVPAHFMDSQREATVAAARIAGFEVVATVNEPTAAAIAYGVGERRAGTILVYDFGGGTLDVTVLRITSHDLVVLSTNGEGSLGGRDIDQALVDSIADEVLASYNVDLRSDPVTKLDLWQRAERLKKDLSVRESASITLSVEGRPVRIDVDRARFLDLAGDLISSTEVVMQRAVTEANLDWGDIDSVVLAGGSSRIPAVRDLVSRVTGKTLSLDIDPDTCVAFGAALYAQQRLSTADGEDRPADQLEPQDPLGEPDWTGRRIHDLAPHSLGVRAQTPDGRPLNRVILPKLTPIPSAASHVFYTASDDQDHFEIDVLQGDDPDPASPGVELIGRTKLEHLPPGPAGKVGVEITLAYDEDGIVSVTARELSAGKSVEARLVEKAGRLDENVIRQKQAEVARAEL